jgi:hypothetical protein
LNWRPDRYEGIVLVVTQMRLRNVRGTVSILMGLEYFLRELAVLKIQKLSLDKINIAIT